MKALVVYESMFGNTAKLARAIADGLSETAEVTLTEVNAAPSAAGFDLLVVGSPTHAFGLSRPASREEAARQGAEPGPLGLREYLDTSVPLPGVAAAAFCTRMNKPMSGSAARKSAKRLRRLGCRVVSTPAEFRVSGTTGPLLESEADRARTWATSLLALSTTKERS
ncbi:flavodoxin domain-containing protein [Actinoplanes sp. NPDC026619]|uniref:flavodoxin family protein n=1 Tax=Actinoplanes sp. NPDC026619 TaxID=3155798 RepID=UPI0033F496C5